MKIRLTSFDNGIAEFAVMSSRTGNLLSSETISAKRFELLLKQFKADTENFVVIDQSQRHHNKDIQMYVILEYDIEVENKKESNEIGTDIS